MGGLDHAVLTDPMGKDPQHRKPTLDGRRFQTPCDGLLFPMFAKGNEMLAFQVFGIGQLEAQSFQVPEALMQDIGIFFSGAVAGDRAIHISINVGRNNPLQTVPATAYKFSSAHHHSPQGYVRVRKQMARDWPFFKARYRPGALTFRLHSNSIFTWHYLSVYPLRTPLFPAVVRTLIFRARVRRRAAPKACPFGQKNHLIALCPSLPTTGSHDCRTAKAKSLKRLPIL
jgi:hypothetical protein